MTKFRPSDQIFFRLNSFTISFVSIIHFLSKYLTQKLTVDKNLVTYWLTGFYQDSDTDEDDIAVDISAASQEGNEEIEGAISRWSGEESEDDDDGNGDGSSASEADGSEEDEDEPGSNEGYENEDNSGEDTESTEGGEDDGPAPPSKRKRLSRVYFFIKDKKYILFIYVCRPHFM